jgi:hypothetical protein
MTAPGPAWSAEEEELLRSLAAAGESAVAIATLLKRSHHAVRKRADLGPAPLQIDPYVLVQRLRRSHSPAPRSPDRYPQDAAAEPIHPKAMPVILTTQERMRSLDACAMG